MSKAGTNTWLVFATIVVAVVTAAAALRGELPLQQLGVDLAVWLADR